MEQLKVAQAVLVSLKTEGQLCLIQKPVGARIIEAMEKNETGAERIQAYAKKRKEDQERDRPKPALVSTRERER